MTTFYFPAYKCSLCEQKFNDGLSYVGLADALNHVPELKKYEPAMLIEDMEDSIYSSDFRDIFELLQYLSDSAKNKREKE